MCRTQVFLSTLVHSSHLALPGVFLAFDVYATIALRGVEDGGKKGNVLGSMSEMHLMSIHNLTKQLEIAFRHFHIHLFLGSLDPRCSPHRTKSI